MQAFKHFVLRRTSKSRSCWSQNLLLGVAALNSQRPSTIENVLCLKACSFWVSLVKHECPNYTHIISITQCNMPKKQDLSTNARPPFFPSPQSIQFLKSLSISRPVLTGTFRLFLIFFRLLYNKHTFFAFIVFL